MQIKCGLEFLHARGKKMLLINYLLIIAGDIANHAVVGEYFDQREHASNNTRFVISSIPTCKRMSKTMSANHK